MNIQFKTSLTFMGHFLVLVNILKTLKALLFNLFSYILTKFQIHNCKLKANFITTRLTVRLSIDSIRDSLNKKALPLK